MHYYTYKVTFKDLPGYFYYGRHKDSGKPYYGSPKTWKRFWKHFEPEVQVLQWYKTAEEVDAAEKAIIDATWGDNYSLNENAGGVMSEEVCRTNGKSTGPATVKAMNDHPNTAVNRSENGKNAGPVNVKVMLAHPKTAANRSENGKKTAKAMNDHPSTAANRISNAKAMLAHPNTIANRKHQAERISKRILLTNTATGESLEFPSAHEAARVLGMHQGNLCSVARGVRKQHKGYTAEYTL